VSLLAHEHQVEAKSSEKRPDRARTASGLSENAISSYSQLRASNARHFTTNAKSKMISDTRLRGEGILILFSSVSKKAAVLALKHDVERLSVC
jgi:hypothetical protein